MLTVTPPETGETPVQVGIRRLSPSRAGDFKTCPQLFKFRAIDRLDEPPSAAMARGTTAHLALEGLFDLPPVERTPEALVRLFRTAWNELRAEPGYSTLFPTREAEREWGLASLDLVRRYFDIEDPSRVEPLQREWPLELALDGVPLYGILDRIDEQADGSLVITDYKTGSAPPERYALGAFFGMKIYAVLVRRLTGKMPTELRLLYLSGPTLYTLDVHAQQLDAMERQVSALWSAIQRAIDRDLYPPCVSRLCDYCSFREICPAFATG